MGVRRGVLGGRVGKGTVDGPCIGREKALAARQARKQSTMMATRILQKFVRMHVDVSNLNFAGAELLL